MLGGPSGDAGMVPIAATHIVGTGTDCFAAMRSRCASEHAFHQSDSCGGCGARKSPIQNAIFVLSMSLQPL